MRRKYRDVIDWGRTTPPLILNTLILLVGYIGLGSMINFGAENLPCEHMLFYLMACVWGFIQYVRYAGFPEFYFKKVLK